MRQFLISLRFRILTLVAIGAIPGILTITIMGVYYREQARTLINTQAINLTRLVVIENDRRLEETRHLLATLALVPGLEEMDKEVCQAYLSQVLSQSLPSHVFLALTKADGSLLCATSEFPTPIPFQKQDEFAALLAHRQFTVGAYQLDPWTERPVVTVAYPSLNNQDEVQFGLLAALDLTWLNTLAENSALPEGFTALLTDEQGTILTRFPEPERWHGVNIAEEALFQNMASHVGPGTVELTGLDGDRRLYAFSTFTTEGQFRAYLCLGLPYSVAFSRANQFFLATELALALIFGVVLAATWVGGNYFILSPINMLIQATKRLAAGDWQARSQLPSHYGELRKLSQAFDHMAVALSHREMERQKYEAALQEHQRTLATLMSNLPGMAYRSRNDPAWTKVFVSEGSLALTGYPGEAFLGEHPISFTHLIHPEDQKRVWEQVQAELQETSGFTLEYRITTASGEEKWVLEKGRKVAEQGEEAYLEGFITDISPLKLSEAKINRQLAYLSALRTIDQAIMGSLDLRLTLEIILEQVAKNLQASAVIYLYQANGQKLSYGAYHGSAFESAILPSFRLGEGLIGQVALTREAQLHLDVQDYRDFGRGHPNLSAEPFNAYAALPLLAKGHLQGVLEVFHYGKQKVTSEWVDFLLALAGQTAIAINNATLFDSLQRVNQELMLSYEATLQGWALALELRDQETEGHSERVTHMTERLAQALGLPEDELRYIRWGALLHDIGKIGVPDHILLKPGKLTQEEWGVMQMHPVYAYNLLSKIHFLGRALDIPYYHHERWDGSGYPHGLTGENIPFSARIFMVVDVWDALSYDRPYRSAWPQEKVLTYLEEEAGRLFDPYIVKTFLTLLNDNSQS